MVHSQDVHKQMALADVRARDRTHIARPPFTGNAVSLQACSYDIRTVVDGNRTLIRSTLPERIVQTVYT